MKKTVAASAAVAALASLGAADIPWTFDTSNHPADAKAVASSAPAMSLDAVGFVAAVSSPAIAVDAVPKATAVSSPAIGLDSTPLGMSIIIR